MEDRAVCSRLLGGRIPEWPFDWTIPEMTGDYIDPIQLSLGRVQLFYSDPMVGLKLQILGDTANKAKKGNLSSSLIVGYGYQKIQKSNIDLGVPDSTLDGTMYFRGLSAGLVTGLRIADSGGIALDFIATQHDTKGTGVVDGTGGVQELTGQTTEYGVGIQFFATHGKTLCKNRQ